MNSRDGVAALDSDLTQRSEVLSSPSTSERSIRSLSENLYHIPRMDGSVESDACGQGCQQQQVLDAFALSLGNTPVLNVLLHGTECTHPMLTVLEGLLAFKLPSNKWVR